MVRKNINHYYFSVEGNRKVVCKKNRINKLEESDYKVVINSKIKNVRHAKNDNC